MTPEKRYALDLNEQDKLRNQKPITETINRTTADVMKTPENNLSSLHNPFNNPFNSQIAKDTKKLLDLNERKGVTSMFLECIKQPNEVQYVYHGDKFPELLKQYENVK